MRILKVSQTYYPYLAEGGRPTKVLAISRALAQRGHSVTVLTADLGAVDKSTRPPEPERCPWGWRSHYHGVEAIYLRSWARYRTLTVNPLAFRFCSVGLREFDLVHIYGLYDLLGCVVASYCRRRRIPYVVEPMGMFQPIVRNLRLKRLYHALLGKPMLRGAGRLIASGTAADVAAQVGGATLEDAFILLQQQDER